MYGRDKAITLAEVHTTLMSKELGKGAAKKSDMFPESLNIKKFSMKKFKQKYEDSKPEVFGLKETRSCHYCKKPGHFKKECYAWKRKQAAEGTSHTNVVSGEADEVHEVMNVVESGRFLDHGFQLFLSYVSNERMVSRSQ